MAALAGLAVALGMVVPASASAGQLRAGAAVVDASWHVGASAGQYASDGSFVDENGSFDPTGHSTRRKSSYGIESRLQTRAIAVDGPKPGDSDLFAIVKNDNYIPQDLVYRRAGQILQERGVLSRGPEQLTMAVTHDHSSPMYSSTSWGVWTFQDVFDVRFYNYLAERMADAVQKAVQNLAPAKVGAAVGQFDKTHRHSFGPAIADDGTPAGYPHSDADHDMTVVRFDGLDGKPIATLFNYALHGEFLDGNDLISADWPGALQKMADEATGGVTVVTQGAVGTGEPERSSYHSIHERLEFTHDEYKQVEYGARLMTGELKKLWDQVGAGVPGTVADPDRFVPFQTSFADDGHEVAQMDRWFPGPVTHPSPEVSNCNDKQKDALTDPRFPVIGLPDCNTADQGLANLSDLIGGPDPPDILPPPIDPGLTTDDFRRAGVPVPDNYGAPGFSGLEEDIDVHLQAFRIGDILFTVCSCEQWKDQSKNIKTRTDRTPNNEYLGWDWKQYCTQNGDGTYGGGLNGYGTGTWKCPNPNDPNPSSPTSFLPDLPDQLVERMHREVVNPANGWNDLDYAPQAESEPPNVTQIKGNYTHDDACKQLVLPTDPFKPENDAWDKPCGAAEQSPSAQLGYKLTVAISMANDYNGYIATYREFQRGDHYRKALTGWGPHSSDYMASRLVDMGRVLNGGDAAKLLPDELFSPKVQPDIEFNNQRATALGQTGGAAISAYEASLPNDGGSAQAVTQPPDIERFDGTFFTWNGGSNFTDNPQVKVQRKEGGAWKDYDGQSGEIPVTIKYPQGPDAASYETGSFEWHWTAHFEAFAGGGGGQPFKPLEDNDATPAGVYRFVVDGNRREGGEVKPYHLDSKEFVVKPWSGITVDDMKLEPDRTVSFKVGPRTTRTSGTLHAEIGPIDYPDTYDYEGKGPLPPFIEKNIRPIRDPAAPNDPTKIEWFCDECSFRPWLDVGDAAKSKVTFVDATGAHQVDASRQGDRWVTSDPLPAGGTAVVAQGCVQDGFGDFNGKDSARLGSGTAAAAACPVEAPAADDRGGSGGGGSNGGAANPLGKALGQVLGAPRGRCAKPTGSIKGTRLGSVRLGATRGSERRKFPSFTARRAGVDRFCLRGGGHIRIGYMSQVGRSLFSRRKRSGDRAVLILTTSRHYSVRRIRHGSSLRALKRRFRRLHAVGVGRNRWYLARARRSRVVFKAHGGQVEEVGIASLRLTSGARRSKRFLRSFPG